MLRALCRSWRPAHSAFWVSRPTSPQTGALLLQAHVSSSTPAQAHSSMKAVTFDQPGGLDVLQYVDVARPDPGRGQVLVKNEFIGVNFIDTYFRSGLYPRPSYPSGLGEEGAGTIDAVGPGVDGLSVGDRVGYTTRSAQGGSYADFTLVAAPLVTKLPDGVSTQDAAAVLLQGLTALSQATVAIANDIKQGDWVLVHAAAGGTGQLLVQIATHLGAAVIGTTSTPEKAAIARSLGAKEVILYTQEDVVARVQELTGGKGVKVVFDGVGKDTFDISLKVLSNLGWLLSFGNASGKPDPFDVLRLGEKSIRLMRPSLFSTLASDTTGALGRQLTQQLFDLVAQGVIKLQVHKVYPLSQAAEAQADLAGRRTTGKLLLRPDHLL